MTQVCHRTAGGAEGGFEPPVRDCPTKGCSGCGRRIRPDCGGADAAGGASEGLRLAIRSMSELLGRIIADLREAAVLCARSDAKSAGRLVGASMGRLERLGDELADLAAGFPRDIRGRHERSME